MKDQVMKMQSRDVKMIVAMFLVLVSPLVATAQVDDVYFVPTKESEEKVLVVKSTAEKYNIDNTSASSMRNVDEYNRRSTVYTNAPDEYIDENYTDEYVYEDDSYDDYSYSTRIIRFRNPRRAVYSSIYWDLMYGCGINDWLIYDNGYSIDIYPTYNNPYYFWSDFAFSWNPFSWYSWHHAAHWGWHHPYYSHYYGHCYDHYYGHHNHIAMRPNHNYWSPSRRNNRYIPTNGAVGGGRYERGEGSRGNRVAASNNNNSGRVNLRGNAGNRGDKVASADRGTSNNNNSGRVNLRGNAGNRGNNAAAQSGNKRNENGAGFKIGSNQGRDNAIRRQQPARGSANVNNNRAANSGKSNSESVRQQKSNSTSNSSNRGSSVNRRGSGSSSGYNRPSSTSVTRSRNSSSSENRSSSSYSRSSSSSRNNSSSYSSGSSSRSSSGLGGGSRGGSSGGSRSGGSRGGGGRGR